MRETFMLNQKKKMTKKYLKEFDKNIEELFWNLGTIQIRTYDELAMMMDLENDDRIKEALHTLENERKIAIMAKGLELWIDYIPF